MPPLSELFGWGDCCVHDPNAKSASSKAVSLHEAEATEKSKVGGEQAGGEKKDGKSKKGEGAAGEQGSSLSSGGSTKQVQGGPPQRGKAEEVDFSKVLNPRFQMTVPFEASFRTPMGVLPLEHQRVLLTQDLEGFSDATPYSFDTQRVAPKAAPETWATLNAFTPDLKDSTPESFRLNANAFLDAPGRRAASRADVCRGLTAANSSEAFAGRLKVKVHAAQHLKAGSQSADKKEEKSDAYVSVLVTDCEVKRTEICSYTLAPIWDTSELVFTVRGRDTKLQLQVHNAAGKRSGTLPNYTFQGRWTKTPEERDPPELHLSGQMDPNSEGDLLGSVCIEVFGHQPWVWHKMSDPLAMPATEADKGASQKEKVAALDYSFCFLQDWDVGQEQTMQSSDKSLTHTVEHYATLRAKSSGSMADDTASENAYGD